MNYKLMLTTLILIFLPGYILEAEEVIKPSLSIISSNENEGLVSDVNIELYDSKENLVDSKRSDSSGSVEFGEIALGTYTVKVADVPQGYQSFNTEYQVNVKNNQHYLITNQLVSKGYSTISLYKKDSRGNLLAGSEQTIYDESNNVVDVIVTDENGFAESKPLEDGTYYIQETKAAEGYELDPKRYTIYVGAKVSSLEYTSVSKRVTAAENIGVQDGSGGLIAGVDFELTDSTGQQSRVTSDRNGLLNLEQLAVGNYTLRLIDNRFSTTNQQYNFSVNSDGIIENIPSVIYLNSSGNTGILELAPTGTESYLQLTMFATLILVIFKKVSM